MSHRVREAMARHIELGSVPGVVWLVSGGGEVHADAQGVMAFGSREPMRRDTIFRIASATKPVTAAAAMMLVEDGRLRLDDPVDKFLPELAERRVLRSLESSLDDTVPTVRPITLRDLLTFRSGHGFIMAMPGTYPVQKAQEDAGVAVDAELPALAPDEWMQRLGGLPLIHQPGEKWMYHTGSDVTGVLIKRVSGKSLEAFMRERIFAPLGMKDTGFHVPMASLARLPMTYVTNPETNERTAFDEAGDREPLQPPASICVRRQWARLDRRRLSRVLPHAARQGGRRGPAPPFADLRRADDDLTRSPPSSRPVPSCPRIAAGASGCRS